MNGAILWTLWRGLPWEKYGWDIKIYFISFSTVAHTPSQWPCDDNIVHMVYQCAAHYQLTCGSPQWREGRSQDWFPKKRNRGRHVMSTQRKEDHAASHFLRPHIVLPQERHCLHINGGSVCVGECWWVCVCVCVCVFVCVCVWGKVGGVWGTNWNVSPGLHHAKGTSQALAIWIISQVKLQEIIINSPCCVCVCVCASTWSVAARGNLCFRVVCLWRSTMLRVSHLKHCGQGCCFFLFFFWGVKLVWTFHICMIGIKSD